MASILEMNLERAEQAIRDALEASTDDALRELLADARAADIASVLHRLDDEERLRVFNLLSTEQAGEVFNELGTETTRDLIDDLPAEKVADILEEMPADEAVDLLGEDIAREQQEELLAEMEPAEAAEVIDLLQYPRQSAGRLMTQKFASVSQNMTISEALAYMRKIDPEVDTLSDLYVLDEQKRLIGVVSLRELVSSEPHERLHDIMVTDVIAVPPETDQEEVARLVSRYDFLNIPVVLPDNRILGIITVDDIIDVLVDESNEDALRFAGVEGGAVLDQPYFTVPMLRVIRTRIGWLMLLFVAETFTGSVLRLFENELQAVVALSFFIPLLIGTGGNTGAQTVSTIIRGMALNQIRQKDWWRVIMRELSSGLILGVLLGVAAFLRALVWGTTDDLALVVGLTIISICTWANTIGAIIPIVAQRLKIDPAVVSAPLITTLVDATGLAIYMMIAKTILGI